jgi:hypothetical protein
MHGACGIIDTACTKKFSNNFEKRKSYFCKTAMVCKKALARESGAQVVLFDEKESGAQVLLFDEKKPGVENLVTLSL